MGKHLPPQQRNSRRWYDRGIWQRRRQHQLAREPFCEPCLRKNPPLVRRAIEVHHVVPFENDWAAFITGPLESRCKACHAEAHGRRNPDRQVIGPDGWPI